eukprot:2299165-Prymnesium_polylepis.1
MRATIAFKWRMFGSADWRMNVVKGLVFNAVTDSGFHLLVFHRPADEEWTTELVLGWVLFGVASLMNLSYAHEEVVQLRAERRAYFMARYNIVDNVLIVLLLVLIPFLIWRLDGAPQMAALTDLLLLVKMAKLSRGHPQLSFLTTMIDQ